jgi:signal transduction histidine kinase
LLIGSRPLRANFALVFSALILILAGWMGAAILVLRRAQSEAESVFRVDIPAMMGGQLFERSLQLDDAALRRYLSGDASGLAAFKRRRSSLDRVRASLRTQSSTAEERSILDRLDALYAKYAEGQDRLIRLRSKGTLDLSKSRSQLDQNVMGDIDREVARLRSAHSGTVARAWQRSDEALSRSKLYVGFFLIGTILMVILLERYMVYLVIRPLEQLADFAVSVDRADPDQPAPSFPISNPRRRDELAQLAWSLNEMSERLHRQLIELKQLDRLKSKFVSTVSHEFRIPVTSMLQYAEMMNEELGGPVTEGQRGYLEVIKKNGQRLVVLIENLLNLAKIEAGQFAVQKRRVELGILCRDVEESVLPLCREKNVKLTLDVPKGLPDVTGDGGLLTLAVTNLVGNAIKYNRKAGTVSLRTEADEKRVWVSVSDTGVGIPAGKVSQIFTPFFRVNPSGTAGTGLGLTITKEIIEAHGGRLKLESSEGRGTTFSFELPIWAEEA